MLRHPQGSGVGTIADTSASTIVVEIGGDASVRVGVSGEARSRAFIRSRRPRALLDAKDEQPWQQVLFRNVQRAIFGCGHPYTAVKASPKADKLCRHIQRDVKQARIVVVEPFMMQLRQRRLISAILFETLQAREICFLPVAQCCTLPLAMSAVLLVGVGAHDSFVLPVRRSHRTPHRPC